MKFALVFDNTGDQLLFEVIYNHELIEWFIKKANNDLCNQFCNTNTLAQNISSRITELHCALSKTNEVLWLLNDINFPQNDNLEDYLDQRFLNRQHALWSESQHTIVNIDALRFAQDSRKSALGWRLHEIYSDDIRNIHLAEAMQKLGYIFAYEEVNMTVHRLENIFATDIEYSAKNKWAGQGFHNPFVNNMISSCDRVNFSFGYTYVGRQYYNKWQFWDTTLEFTDHYNYEKLQWSFQLNLDRPRTITWSPEFVDWAKTQQVPLITTQIPIANVVDLEKNLTRFRKMLYNNAKQQNAAKLFLT
jgi:hypothetical protein